MNKLFALFLAIALLASLVACATTEVKEETPVSVTAPAPEPEPAAEPEPVAEEPAAAAKDRSASCAACTVLILSLLRGFTIISAPSTIRNRRVRKASLNKRLVRLRTTAVPSFLDTTTAKRAGRFWGA